MNCTTHRLGFCLFQNITANFRLQNGLTLLSRIWISRSKSKKAHKMILTCCLRRLSKSVVSFRKTHILVLRKKSVFQEISTFSVFFSLVDQIIHICIKTWLKMRLSNVFKKKKKKKKMHFLFKFAPQNYAFRNRYFKVLLYGCPWACKWFLVKCILILSRLGKEKTIWKVVSYNFR